MNQILQKFELSTRIEYPASVQINQELKVPVKESFLVPVEARVRMDTVVHSHVEIPLELELTEADLAIDTMAIAVDQNVMIQDDIEINMKDLLDSIVDVDKVWLDRLRHTLPLKKTAKIRVHQPVRITGSLNPKVGHLNIKLKKTVKLDVAVPINQEVSVQGTASVKLDQEIVAPIQAAVPVTLDQPINVKILGLRFNNSSGSE